MSSVFSRLYRVVCATLSLKLLSFPLIRLVLAYLLLGLVYLIARQHPNETYLYFFAWKLAVLNGLVFFALSPNEPKIKGVMVGTITTLALLSFSFYALKSLGVGF